MSWIPAISTSALMVLVLWLLRNLIITRLTKSVSHEYDKKIENLKTSLRQSEETFRAELKAKEAQIEALRTGALSGIINKQASLYQRQILAVEQIWDAAASLLPAKNVSALMASVKFDAMADEAAKDPRVREIFTTMGGVFDMSQLKMGEASKARPFISPLAWAFYSAYEAIVVYAVFRLKILQAGVAKDFANEDSIKRLVKVALPHHADYVEKFGASGFHYLLEELEHSLLEELAAILRGEKSDKESIERAASIIKEAENLMETNKSMEKAE